MKLNCQQTNKQTKIPSAIGSMILGDGLPPIMERMASAKEVDEERGCHLAV